MTRTKPSWTYIYLLSVLAIVLCAREQWRTEQFALIWWMWSVLLAFAMQPFSAPCVAWIEKWWAAKAKADDARYFVLTRADKH